jgi:hypothetical protein
VSPGVGSPPQRKVVFRDPSADHPLPRTQVKGTFRVIGGPDYSRGGGGANPEQKMDWIQERHEREIREAQADHVARELRQSKEAGTGRLPWYRRIFRRTAP